MSPELSRPRLEVTIIIPAFNEAESLPGLFKRLFPVLEGLGRSCEAIFINDGSRDATLPLLLRAQKRYPGLVKVVDFNGNFGQHMAILAGFDLARGDVVITLDADLQNPPEEIPRIVECIDRGHDVVGTIRRNRRDSWFRRAASRVVNRLTNRITGLSLHDYGCMLRGYRRDVIDIINESAETTTFIPALAQKFALNPVEIDVEHSERERGISKYSLFRLIRLNFDLMTGFSLAPLQAVTMMGLLISLLSFFFAVFMFARRLIVGPEAEGMFTLTAILFLLMGVTISCIGIEGEYVGRIYQEVRGRPRYVIRRIYEKGDGEK
ncbi:MAG: glycosyltransferase [Synergistaceae bacterium]|jgi:undecaprenyl-phosphate 4-deoxy-4-formamido-L-arabinose transferase|nr:glycosyltransferase [Synergistaceae bacterium]